MRVSFVVNRKQFFNASQEQRRRGILENISQAVINLSKVLQDSVLLIINAYALAVEHCPFFAPATRDRDARAGVCLKL